MVALQPSLPATVASIDLHPLQGIPGATELLVLAVIAAILLVIPAAVGYWVARDVRERGSDHHLAWGVMTFLSAFGSLLGLLVFLVFYLVVREDVGAASS